MSLSADVEYRSNNGSIIDNMNGRKFIQKIIINIKKKQNPKNLKINLIFECYFKN